MTVPNITTVVASAGAGKTTRIVGNIAKEVTSRDPETIVATTFTVKAADELIERSRAKLFELGMPDKAARLLGARFGTVNAICGQIVSENAIALGRSPRAEVIPEGSVPRIFAIAADAAIERHAPTLNSLADVMGFFEPKRAADAERSDWRTTVRRLIELARANGIPAQDLSVSAERSVATFLELLPPVSIRRSDDLDADLRKAVSSAVTAVPVESSATAKPHVMLLRQTDASIRRGERISWPNWARLSKVGCAKKDGQAFIDALDAVAQAASRHPAHPRLREDCSQFIRSVFACATEALTAFQAYKAKRGLLDFTDQEALALDVLRDPVMSAGLGERIGRLFVDEFQDSSPLQVAIFTAMSGLVDASTWVGDPKQAIYGFRNADSALTQAAFAGVAASSSEPQDVLATSYRSREGIINLVNAAFAPALSAMGLKAEDHAFSGTGRSEEGFTQAPLAVWWLEGKLELQYAALAAQIREMVTADQTWEVAAKPNGVRALRAGDIAILCRSKADIAKVSAALSQQGVKAAVEREGLTQTPHVQLVMAAFRWVADPTDRLALAELARFFAEDPESETWLEALGAENASEALLAIVPISTALQEIHEGILSLTPADLIDAIILLPELNRHIESWGDVPARLDDLEALRGFARSYEESCAGEGSPATPSGLALALAAENPARPRSLRDDAVKVMTYHGAKGLEWPVVILTGLGKEPKPRLFEPMAEADGDVDWQNPLVGRWIRYWPWPYASQEKDVYLDSSAPSSALGQRAAIRSRDEEARLLYVGMTRARDHLVFAAPAKGTLHWLKVLDGDETEHFALPRSGGEEIHAGTKTFPARTATLVCGEGGESQPPVVSFGRIARPATHRAPLYRRPSEASSSETFIIVEKSTIGPRLPFAGSPDMTLLGEAVHAIIAADQPHDSYDARLIQAQAILDRWGVHQVAAKDVLEANERLFAEISKRWPSGRIHRETPVSARIGDQLVTGRIDLLVEHDSGFAIIDHKSFPGSPDSWDARAVGHGSQIQLYADALDKARPGVPCELFIHMPIVGGLLQVGTSSC
ncbi:MULTISPECIES: UvrD-helicase domain-containing protein [unclassified Sphingobium]|uniref:UvrD-helicase domain-containing protein n=1 Tax=unclassified Sphingobium TaxID=2611147 RepID=UPI0005CC8CF3|nr:MULTISPECIES: UvrD-helicase domain-containing protein [unclassified Sphingobium]AJR24399.1 uvrD/REP helicase [Sphingobium sp. YBL2]AMK16813.1 uvrD/REP helicase [Sphingobium sp. MI1205]